MTEETHPTRGGQHGNTNAQRGDAAATSKLTCRCLPSDKAAWVKAAQASGQKLSEWVIATLNKASGQ